MKTTVKRTSVSFTEETLRQLDEICGKFLENRSQVIMRAIQLMHYSLRFPNLPITGKEAHIEDTHL